MAPLLRGWIMRWGCPDSEKRQEFPLPRRLRENWEQTNPLRQSLECRYSPVVLVVLSLRSPVSTVVDRSAGTLAIENMRIYGARVSGRDDNEVKRIRYLASLHNGFSRERFRLS